MFVCAVPTTIPASQRHLLSSLCTATATPSHLSAALPERRGVWSSASAIKVFARQTRFCGVNNGRTEVFSVEAKVKEISDADFPAEVLSADVPVMVDFYAQWCGPCKLVAPLMDWADAEYKGKLKVFKMNVDPNPASVAEYKVYGLPSLVLFSNGQVLDKHEGAIAKGKLKIFIEKTIPELAS
uniref:Thioredoxin domain-containing protein n=1 Tax=Cyanoptyche gloeocystis TaxID=77922 RepID=A0A7S2JP70_9EUKA|mmetsp:Transcript_2627/g.4788  ORF Transcript_2627/g.4788 Transcript_2627/m.4788 type:complete len:183 (+) Transcript_2627:89-637(+)|eukprot:CAMPEP_0196661480 /NCGR_PEP_ID=MMETSP1086-20130531/44496_1 /TAXON_ID=77921 /ORGANISM="Cyanoptyche  gloeocystis , Strain SAG4.97" /LENGTH=182 /DNA_ID=CAMNT_0041996395 /DNA_START=68 /DNA_END=616 /DNA_ORIENTATION=-